MEISTLSDSSLREMQEMVRWWRQFGRGLRSGESGGPIPPPARHIRWGKTATTTAVPTYPSSGNVLPIVLGQYVFDDTTAGQQTPTFTAYTPADERLAYFPTGYRQEGTIARFSLHDNMWWEVTGGANLVHCKTAPSDGHVDANIQWTSGALPAFDDGTGQMGGNYCELWSSNASGLLTQTLDAFGYATPVYVYNPSQTAIPAEKHVKAINDGTGLLIAIWQDCP